MPYTQVAEDFIQHYGPQYRLGLLIDDVERFVAASGLTIPAASGSGLTWAVVVGGKAYPVVCGDLVWVYDEDGRHDGRCGSDATHQGACEQHFVERESYRALSEAERCHLEREEDAWAL